MAAFEDFARSNCLFRNSFNNFYAKYPFSGYMLEVECGLSSLTMFTYYHNGDIWKCLIK